MPKKVLIRPARPKDALVVAQLMYYASSNYILAFFGKPESKAIGVLRRMFRLPRHTTSYTYAFVAEDEGDVVGAFSGFDGKSWRVSARASWMYGPIWFAVIPPWQIPRMIAAFADFSKAMPLISNEEYYIEHLAVLPEKRGQGIGEQLMEFAENQARAKGLKRVTLSVGIENEGARRLYERLGFQTIKVVADSSYCKRFNFQGSIRMAKPI
jgi:ribosomal protein S18 acetylase RimI-like enzyme